METEYVFLYACKYETDRYMNHHNETVCIIKPINCTYITSKYENTASITLSMPVQTRDLFHRSTRNKPLECGGDVNKQSEAPGL